MLPSLPYFVLSTCNIKVGNFFEPSTIQKYLKLLAVLQKFKILQVSFVIVQFFKLIFLVHFVRVTWLLSLILSVIVKKLTIVR